MQVGIVGIGHVGSLMFQLFPEAIGYDGPRHIGTKEEINQCDISFICVPTPQREDGACDTSIVEDVLDWLNTDVIVIRSTVPVGFTTQQSEYRHKHIVFQPEYYGETKNHRFEDPKNRNWITLGGREEDCRKVANLYKTAFTSDIIIHYTDAKTAELAKYMENSFYAAKVTFCNQFYELADALNVNYDKLRETWLLDPRISRDHTFVYEDNRGYGGSCLPKDLSAIIYQGKNCDVNVDFLEGIEKTNKEYVNYGKEIINTNYNNNDVNNASIGS